MSGLAQGRTPANDAELIRSMMERIRALEEKQTLRAGDWVVGNDDGGRAVITNSEGRKVVLTPDPEPDPPVQGDAAISGTCARMSRRVGSPYQFSLSGTGGGQSAFPGDAFDTIDYTSSNMAGLANLADGSFTTPDEGQYLVHLSLWLSAGQGSPSLWLSVWLDGVEYARSNTFSSQQGFSDTWVVHAAKGQVIQPRRTHSSSEVGIGNSVGSATHITINRIP